MEIFDISKKTLTNTSILSETMVCDFKAVLENKEIIEFNYSAQVANMAVVKILETNDKKILYDLRTLLNEMFENCPELLDTEMESIFEDVTAYVEPVEE